VHKSREVEELEILRVHDSVLECLNQNFPWTPLVTSLEDKIDYWQRKVIKLLVKLCECKRVTKIYLLHSRRGLRGPRGTLRVTERTRRYV
jgi:hypothetical protein